MRFLPAAGQRASVWRLTATAAMAGAAVAVVLAGHLTAPDRLAAQTPTPPPSRTRCAGYDVITDQPSRMTVPQNWPTRLRVVRSGRTLWALQGDPDAGSPITSLLCRDITGDGTPELVFETYSGGAHCCWTPYFIALVPAVRLILRYEAGNSGGVEIADLDRDGRPELLLGDDHFAYFDDLCYACSPARFLLVACFRNGRFQDCTRSFPGLLRQDVARRTRDLREFMRQGTSDPTSLMFIRGAALGLYASYVLLGEDATGWVAVGAIVSHPAVTTWLTRHRDAVRRWASSRGARLRN